MHAIGECARGIETSDDLLIGPRNVGNGYIENRGVLTGKGDIAVLADGGTANRQPLFRGENVSRIGHSLVDGLRQRGG